MRTLIFPEKYVSKLSLRETQRAIKLIKDTFQSELGTALNLDRITAPIIVRTGSGINDDLNGIERKVHFTMAEMGGEAEVVQSLAKWKRMALYRYGYGVGEGIYADMNAIRRDDSVDNTHSLFVDQWDWEKVISREDRCEEYLKNVVLTIVRTLCKTQRLLNARYPMLKSKIREDVYFITAEELLRKYPDKTSKEREDLITREHGTVFIMQIGASLSNGESHDGRAPDYDDWSLNGDIFVWNEVLGHALEISSMGIRVDAQAMERQLVARGATDRRAYPYHRMVLDGTLPLTVGGGIGQSRICMLLLEKAHVGEVQSSVWPEEMIDECRKHGIVLL